MLPALKYGGLCVLMLAALACQPDEPCHGGRVLKAGACVPPAPVAPSMDAGSDAGSDAGETQDAGSDAGRDAGAPVDAGSIPEAPYCSTRPADAGVGLHGMACTSPAECAPLTCANPGGYCTSSDCDPNDACTCPPGFVCTQFAPTVTACVFRWGRGCTTSADCTGQASLCVPGAGYCTSECDPGNPRTCPDTWMCRNTPGGNFCVRP